MKTSTVAEEIRTWRSDIRMMDSAAPCYRAAIRCWCFNWATSTAALRTDREWSVCRKLAKRVRSELATLPGWHEMESGMLWTKAL